MFRFLIYSIFSLVIVSTSVWAKPPEFSDFPVKEIYKGKIHPAQKKDEFPFSNLEQVLKAGEVNFAGHYIIYMDGCGTDGCVIYSIADVKTGKDIISIPNVYMGDIEEPLYALRVDYKVNSKLIHISGVDAEKTDLYLDDYYILDKDHLRKIAGKIKTIQKDKTN